MSEKTKIVVIRMRELLYTAIFTALVIILIVVLVYMFLPQKEEREENAPVSTQIPETTASATGFD